MSLDKKGSKCGFKSTFFKILIQYTYFLNMPVLAQKGILKLLHKQQDATKLYTLDKQNRFDIIIIMINQTINGNTVIRHLIQKNYIDDFGNIKYPEDILDIKDTNDGVDITYSNGQTIRYSGITIHQKLSTD